MIAQTGSWGISFSPYRHVVGSTFAPTHMFTLTHIHYHTHTCTCYAHIQYTLMTFIYLHTHDDKCLWVRSDYLCSVHHHLIHCMYYNIDLWTGTVLKAAEPVGRPDHCQELLQREQSAGHRGCPWASPGIKIKRTPAVWVISLLMSNI